MNAPVVLFYYNRPDKLQIILDQLKKVSFSKIYSFCDGPKNKKDKINVDICRGLIQKYFPLGYHTYYDENIGYNYRLINDLKSVFKYEQEGIILEDDTFFDEQFFDASNFILNKYKNDKNIFCFKGYNNLIDINEDAYIHTKLFSPPWGWACWKRSIDNIINFSNYESIFVRASLEKIKRQCRNAVFLKHLDDCKVVRYSSWDNHLFLTVLLKNYNIIMPGKNLIKNIGYGHDATGSINSQIKYANNEIIKGFKFDTDTIKDYNFLNEDNFADVVVSHETKVNGIPIRLLPL